jgi:CBS domain-containing protein
VSLARRQRQFRSEFMHSLVKDVMTTDVVAVREVAGYKDIVAVMRQRRISALPVLDGADHLVGIVSEADLLLKEIGPEAAAGHWMGRGHRRKRAKAAGVIAADLMTKPAVAIGPHESVAAAARQMHDHRVKRLPVVDNAGRLVGIVSRVDVLSVFGRPDREIRDEVMKVIGTEFALDPAAFDVTVTSGILTIAGQIDSHAVAAQLMDTLQHLEGVVDIRYRVSYLADQPRAAVFPPPRPS